jgi:hypothetical protein
MDSGRSARVGVAFVILGFSLLGVLPPLVAAVRQHQRRRSGGGYDDAGAHGAASARELRVKAFAAGVMLSLSVVHVVYDAFATLSQLETQEERYPLFARYPMGGPFIVFGILRCAPPAVLRACCGNCVPCALAGAEAACARAHGAGGMCGHGRRACRHPRDGAQGRLQRADALTRCALRARQHVFSRAGRAGLHHAAGGARHARGSSGARR